MKSRNQYRRHHREQQAASANVRLLEAALSIKDRLFSIVALRRGLRRLRRWAIILLIVLLVVTNAMWLWAWNQYDYVDEYSIEAEQDGEGINIVGGGNVDYGAEGNSNQEKLKDKE